MKYTVAIWYLKKILLDTQGGDRSESSGSTTGSNWRLGEEAATLLTIT